MLPTRTSEIHQIQSRRDDVGTVSTRSSLPSDSAQMFQCHCVCSSYCHSWRFPTVICEFSRTGVPQGKPKHRLFCRVPQGGLRTRTRRLDKAGAAVNNIGQHLFNTHKSRPTCRSPYSRRLSSSAAFMSVCAVEM